MLAQRDVTEHNDRLICIEQSGVRIVKDDIENVAPGAGDDGAALERPLVQPGTEQMAVLLQRSPRSRLVGKAALVGEGGVEKQIRHAVPVGKGDSVPRHLAVLAPDHAGGTPARIEPVVEIHQERHRHDRLATVGAAFGGKSIELLGGQTIRGEPQFSIRAAADLDEMRGGGRFLENGVGAAHIAPQPIPPNHVHR